MLATLDWIIIIGFLLLIVSVGLSFAQKGSKDLSSFFLGGRNLPWYIAGISMVATTFAADTPLAVTEIVRKDGISGNWLWWNALIGGMLTTFFFAKLWRKSGVLTEVELIELRYSGAPARFLRGFKAVYLGLFMNVIIIGWVNLAMISLMKGFFGFDYNTSLAVTAVLMLLVAIYSSVSGLLGIAITDVIQFFVAITGCIILAVIVVNNEKIGGIDGLKEAMHDISPTSLNFFPTIGGEEGQLGMALSLSFASFFAFIGVQWWASWYPGAEPGGGGYVAQRMMSAKSEKDAVYATLFFQIAHYCIRPWPWILVGLCTFVLYPELSESEYRDGFVYAMDDFLPAGLKGMLLVAFIAAYMSTISTQLNWGASYLVNDIYKRFVSPNANNKKLISISRITTLVLMVISIFVTTQLETIESAWKFIFSCGAGLGLVLILRWYWWRINAWSEISATIAPFAGMTISYFVGWEFPNAFLFTVCLTTVVWLIVTFITPPTSEQTLQHFFNKVRPDGAWNNRTVTKIPKEDIALGENQEEVLDEIHSTKEDTDFSTIGTKPKNNLLNLFICWISSIVMTYGILFLTGKIIFKEWADAGILTVVVLLSFLILNTFIKKTRIFGD